MNEYLCRYYLNNRLQEEIVMARSPFDAERMIEAKYSGGSYKFRWSGPPNLAKNSIRWI